VLTSSRRLLVDLSNSCTDLSSVFVASPSSPQEIVVNSSVPCGAGDVVVYYDIGVLDANGVFVPSSLAAFAQNVTIQRGPAAQFTLWSMQRVQETAFTDIQSFIVVIALDLGLNVRCTLATKTKSKFRCNNSLCRTLTPI
jgi:hypothetical protein